LARYLRAAAHRLDRVAQNPELDRRHSAEIRGLEEELAAALAALPAGRAVPAALREIPWLLEELRVALFAQPLGARKVSAKRIRRALAEPG
ncbi:MAG: DUF3418 domain-containing protein, partial [Solirubrobacterales bacterium]|nr:DUF3418 domain-containing protein [Solirubrobacterales bacterium]